MLTEEYKKKRMGFVLDFLTCYAEAGDEFLDHIVTGDEKWVYPIHLNPSNNQCNGTIQFTKSREAQNFDFSKKIMASVFWVFWWNLCLPE